MTLTPPSSGETQLVPSAPTPYAAPSPAASGAPWAGSPVSPTPGTSGSTKARPSWVAWTALGLSALSFLVATSIGIIYAANSLSGGDTAEDEGYFYDAGRPSWGTVDLTPTGAATDLTLTNSVTEALYDGVDDGTPVEDVFCEALPAPKKDTVATCSALVDDLDSTVVLFFLDDDGNYLATIY